MERRNTRRNRSYNLTKILILYCTLTQAQIIEPDKISHFLGGGLTSAVTYEYTDYKTSSKRLALKNSIFSSIFIGTIKEAYDSTQPNNVFDGQDLAYSVLGGVTIAFTFNLLNRNKNEKINDNLVRSYRKHRKRSRKKEKK